MPNEVDHKSFNPLLRAISSQDSKMLLEAIAKGGLELNNCIDNLGSALGLDAEQLSQISSLAQTLYSSKEQVQEAKLTFNRIDRSRGYEKQRLAALQKRKGVAQADSGQSYNDSFAIDYTAHREGHGPQGGFGEGHSLPSPQKRAAQIAADNKERALKAQNELNNYDNHALESGVSNGFDGRKKIDHSSKFDYSNQQHDLEVISKGGVAFKTKQLTPLKSNLQEEIEQRYLQERKAILELIPKVKGYNEYLGKVFVTHGFIDVNHGRSEQYSIKDILLKAPQIISNIEQMNQNKKHGIPINTNVAKLELGPHLDSHSSLEQQEHNFTLNNQGSHGYDINDPRHLGAQVASGISLTNNEPSKVLDTSAHESLSLKKSDDSGAIKEQSTNINLDTANNNEQVYDNSTSVKPELSSNTLTLDPDPNNTPAFEPQSINAQANRSLDYLASNMADLEGYDNEEASIDDILGSNVSEKLGQAPQLETIDLQTVKVSDNNTLESNSDDKSVVAGASSIGHTHELQDDLPPWRINDEDKRVFCVPSKDDALPQVESLGANQESDQTIGSLHKLDDSQESVLQTHSAVVTNQEGAYNKGSMVVSAVSPSQSMSLNAPAQDKIITAPQSGIKRIDGSHDISAEEAKVYQATQDLHDINNSIMMSHNAEDKEALQNAKGKASLNMLDSLEGKLAKDIELSDINGPSPWALLNQAQVLTVNGHSINVEKVKLAKLQKINDNNFLVSGNVESKQANPYVFNDPLIVPKGANIPQWSAQDFVSHLAQIKVEQQQAQLALHQEQEKLELYKQNMLSKGYVFHDLSNDLLRIMALSSQASQQELDKRIASEAPNNSKAFMFGTGEIKAPQVAIAWEQVGSIAPQVNLNINQNSNTNISAPSSNSGEQNSNTNIRAPSSNSGEQNSNTNISAPSSNSNEYQINHSSQSMTDALTRPDYITEHDDLYLNTNEDDNEQLGSGYNGEYSGDYDIANIDDHDSDLPYNVADYNDVPLVDAQPIEGSDRVITTIPMKMAVLPGLRPMSDDDFYPEVLDQDEWLALISKVFPNKGLEYSILTRSSRKIEDGRWIITLSKADECEYFLPNIVKAFNEFTNSKLNIEVVKENDTPREAPCYKAYFAHQQAIAIARQKIAKVHGFNSLVKNLGLDLANVDIELYTKDVH